MLGILAALIVFSNAFTMAVIGSSRALQNATGFLMASLAVADMGVGLTTAGPLLYAAFTDTLSKAACDVMGFLNSVTWVVSVYTLMLLSTDRFATFTSPLRYNTLVTNVRSLRCYSDSVGGQCFPLAPSAG